MGFSTKYYEAVFKGQADLPLGSEAPPFDFERKRKTTLFGRAVGWFLENPDWWLGILRNVLPRFRVGKVVFLLGFEDVREVLERESEFETPYGPELREFSGGLDFLLSLKDGKLYRTQKSVVLSAFPPREVEERVRDIAAKHSQEIVRHAGEKFDAATDLMRIVPVRICREYYGLQIDDERQFGNWAIAINHILFGDWNADPVTRELAVAAAENMFAAVDRSIDIAEAAIERGDDVDNPLGRLIRMSKDDGLVAGRQEVRAIMIGMVVGFAPTNLLGGINCLEAVLSRPEIFDCIKKAVDEKDNTRLDKAVLEAMRFKPHWIWPWRYAREERTIGVGRPRPYRIPANVSVLPFTRSAMFDASVVRDPWTFNPDRSLSENMVFGVGIHRCIGASIASVQVAEAFRALFNKPGFRRAHGKEGKLTRIGPYPDKLMVEFDAPAENRLTEQALVTVCVPVRTGVDTGQLQKEVDSLGNPADGVIQADLDRTGIIHFASLTAISTSDTGKKSGDGFHLVLELSGDGSKRTVIEAFVGATQAQLQPIFERFAAGSLKGSLEAFLLKHSIDVSPQFGEMSGLVFAGTPGHSVARIKAEQELATKLGTLVEEQTLLRPPSTAVISDSSSAGDILKEVRRELEQNEYFDWAFSPARSLLEKPGGTLLSATVHSIFNLRTAIPLIVLVGFFTWMTYYLQFDKGAQWFRTVARLGDSLILAVGGLVLAAAISLTAVALRLRHIEQREEIRTAGIELDELTELQKREDKEGYVQNHMTAVSVIKPGWWLKPGVLRRFLLRFSFYVISIAARRAFRPGYLGDISTIHFARWVRIPHTDRLVFFSNYGGSWESYLEDFVTKASAGLTGIWSNTKGFPRTRFLFLDGSRDGDRFKRWARAEQIPTSFWYSAYPDLNTTMIRKNSRIRQGFYAARASQARDWLSLFTSLPRQDGIKPSLARQLLNQTDDTSVESLESGEIQSLIFGPLGNLEHAVMFAFEVDKESSAAQRREVLAHLLKHTSFGDTKPGARAMFCVFGPDGLTKLGLTGSPNGNTLGSFPLTFRQGMADDYRSRILDDRGDSAPENWSWGSKTTPVDLAMICYAADKAKLDGMALEVGNLANRTRLIPRAVIPLMIDRTSVKCPAKDVGEGDEEKRPAREHFGFVDGVS